MPDSSYVFSALQSAFLDALRAGRYAGNELTDYGRKRISLRDRMPAVYQQSMRGTCVANAVTALLEYYEDRKIRLSVQFLFEMTKTVERRWLDANLAALGENRDVDAEFAAKFPKQVAQIRLTTDSNGVGSPAAKAFLGAFARRLGTCFNDHAGSQIKRCFEAVREYGTCRYSLWPYANMQVADPTAGGTLPPGSLEDAAKHRVLTGLYLLRSPNNVDEIRGIIAGANGRRPMPVCVGLPLFDGCDGTDFRFPESVESEGRFVSRNALKGVHEMLIVGYEDDKSAAGGGWFVVRNSWGADWGKDGYGRIPYAYVECFCTEAGTILQDIVDYVGDGYGAAAAASWGGKPRGRKWGCALVFLGLVALIVGLSALAVVFVVPELKARNRMPEVLEKLLPSSAEPATNHTKVAAEKRLAEEKKALEAEKVKLAQERREAEERRLAEIEAEKHRLADEAEKRRIAEVEAEKHRLADEAEKRRIAEVEAEKRRLAEEAEKRRIAEVEAEKRRLAEEAEKRRIAEVEAEKRRLAEEAEKRHAAEAEAAVEREKTYEYLVHVALACHDEDERDAVMRCLGELSGSVTDGMTNTVDNVTAVEYAAGRNLFGIVQKGYQVRCGVRLSGAGEGVRRPTDVVRRLVGQTLNARCQFEDKDRIDWGNFTRMSCRQDFGTVRGHLPAPQKSNAGVRMDF